MMDSSLSRRQKSVLAFFSLFAVFPEVRRFEHFFGAPFKKSFEKYFSAGKSLNTSSEVRMGEFTPPLSLSEEKPLPNTSSEYLKKGKKWALRLRYLPFVSAVAIVNTVSFGVATKESDIDLLVVVKKGRMWTARFLVTLFLFFCGVRRSRRKIAGRLCLSFFIDETVSSFAEIKKETDPYLAFWLTGMIPVFGRQFFIDVYEKNKEWVEKEIGLPLLFSPPNEKSPTWKKYTEKAIPLFFETLIRKFWKKRTLKKAAKLKNPSGTIVTDTILKFHDNDRRDEIREKFEERLQELSKKKNFMQEYY